MRRLILTLAFLVGLLTIAPLPAQAVCAVGNRATIGPVDASPASGEFTVSGTSPLIVAVHEIIAFGTISSVTWNTSESLTLIGSGISAGLVRSLVYVLNNPTATTANVVVTWSAAPSGGAIVHVIGTTGCDTATGIRTVFERDDSDGTGPGLTVTDSQSGDLVIHAAVVFAGGIAFAVGETTTSTETDNVFGSGWSAGMSTQSAVGGNTAVDTTDEDFYGEVAFAVIAPGGGGGGTTGCRNLLLLGVGGACSAD